MVNKLEPAVQAETEKPCLDLSKPEIAQAWEDTRAHLLAEQKVRLHRVTAEENLNPDSNRP